jgi:aldose 1-epimerase
MCLHNAAMISLAANGDRVDIDPNRGGRLTSLFAGGRERLLGPPPGADAGATSWGCFVMAPWVGRAAGSSFDWAGREWRLRPNLGPHAIHGVVFDVPWAVVEATGDLAVVEAPCDPDRWPLGGLVRHRARLAPQALELTLEVEARDDDMPACAGWHPWFRRPVEGDVSVKVSSKHTLETTPDLIPTGRHQEVKGDTDLRFGPRLGPRRLDHPYTRVSSPTVVTWPDLELTMHFSPPIETVVVYTPPEGFCVEPLSAWPDALRLARTNDSAGLVALRRGDKLSITTRWTWRALES